MAAMKAIVGEYGRQTRLCNNVLQTKVQHYPLQARTKCTLSR